ncbi:MAG: OB-fold nucleic acid binding domain-containing protein, partial [Bryobacteraceae bacterium]
MKSPYVRDLRPNQVETAIFLVHSKEIRQKKTGEPYLSLLLGDRSGDIDAKMWDNVAEVIDTFDRDDFIRAKGLLNVYQNRPQFTIHKLVRVDEAEVDPADFFPVSSRDPEEMWTELRGIVSGMSNPDLKGLVEALLDDPEIGRLYRRAPAAKMIHHAYLGGLLEHVLSLCDLCRFMASHYSDIDLN